ncbi:MAG TPA: SusC/RagA family TonB-linked outer membrane protein, partial [Arachidicoccus sp.]
NLQAHLQLQYRPINNLTLRVSGGYSDLNHNQTYVKPKKSMDPSQTPVSNTTFGSNGLKTWIIEPQAEYNQQIGKGRIDVLVGGTFQSSLTTGSYIYGTNFSNEALLLNLQSAQSVTIYSYTHTPYRYDAIFGRINYNWNSKYLIDLTARRDGSSRFGPGNQFGNFGAVGAGWIFSEESFVKRFLPFLNYGKLRGSYGSTGSANIGDYQYLSQWKPNTYAYDNTSTLSPTAHYNPDYGWEVNKKLEIAMEMGFLKNRLQATFSWFRNRSDNQLVSMPLPVYTGFSSVTANLPATVQNTGWEATFVSTNIENGDFKWNTSFNITISRNKLLAFPGLASSSYATKYEIGKPLSLQRKLHFQGVDPETGSPIFEDVNGDGKITTTGASNDLEGRYNLAPSFYGGLNNEIRYKNWDLSFFFQFTKQKGALYFYSLGAPGTMNNQSVNILKRWQKPGDITNVPKVSTILSTDYTNFSANSDAAITDASFARLQNVSLSYTFPNKWVKHYHSQYTRLYIQGQNLLTITGYKGADPDTQSLTAIPPVKFLTAGIQITF